MTARVYRVLVDGALRHGRAAARAFPLVAGCPLDERVLAQAAHRQLLRAFRRAAAIRFRTWRWRLCTRAICCERGSSDGDGRGGGSWSAASGRRHREAALAGRGAGGGPDGAASVTGGRCVAASLGLGPSIRLIPEHENGPRAIPRAHRRHAINFLPRRFLITIRSYIKNYAIRNPTRWRFANAHGEASAAAISARARRRFRSGRWRWREIAEKTSGRDHDGIISAADRGTRVIRIGSRRR